MLKFSGLLIWRLGSSGSLRRFSNVGSVVHKVDNMEAPKTISNANEHTEDVNDKGLVAAAFASLNCPDTEYKAPSAKSATLSKVQQLDNQILKAKDINSLLTVAQNSFVSRKHALKMVSILSDWSNSNKVKLSDFEKDPRFLKLCRILARTSTAPALNSLSVAEDLSTVLGITGDDEAARLITNLTLPQMVKVMKVLNQKGRRSTPLLRALSHNITSRSDVIDLKKAADLLFSMASLNFPDPLLLDRICNDVIECLPSYEEKPAVVNSIVVSLGLMRYRHEPALAALCEWLRAHAALCRPSDVASAAVTLGTLGHVPPAPAGDALLEAALCVKEEELVKASSWLDLVFALLVLGRALDHQLESTLQPEFIDKLLSSGEIPIPARRKLMAIDGYLALRGGGGAGGGARGGAGGGRLPEDVSVGVPLVHTKEKALYVASIMDTFRTMVSADTFMRRHCDSGMGFLYDAEFAVNSKCHPVPLKLAKSDKSVFRIAVLGLDYHDMSRRAPAPLGAVQLYTRLLRLQGFHVLQIPYTEYNPKDKLVARVQYVERRLRDLVAGASH